MNPPTGLVEAQRNVFKISKEENFTRNDGQSERSSKPVLVITRLIVLVISKRKKCAIGRVEPGVLQIVVDAPVYLVGARADDRVELRSTGMSEQRAVLILHEAEFRLLLRSTRMSAVHR